MCTVVVERVSGELARILALRDELTSRGFDEPERWWPEHPSLVGGRDRTAGGSWCVSDVDTGVTALVLNRTERREGTPSRGGLPLAAATLGERWVDAIAYRTMASFTLLLVTPDSTTGWTWDARALRRVELGPGRHMATPAGIDQHDERTVTHLPRFAAPDWRGVVAASPPRDEPGALVVRHPVPGGGVWATVFGQLITAEPGQLSLDYSRTPWLGDSWTTRRWTPPAAP